MHSKLFVVLLLPALLTCILQKAGAEVPVNLRVYPESNTQQLASVPGDQTVAAIVTVTANAQHEQEGSLNLRSIVFGYLTNKDTIVDWRNASVVDHVTSQTLRTRTYIRKKVPVNGEPPAMMQFKFDLDQELSPPFALEVHLPIYHIDKLLFFQLEELQFDGGIATLIPVWATTLLPGYDQPRSNPIPSHQRSIQKSVQP